MCTISKKDDNHYMLLALTEASKAFDKGEVPIGAVLVDVDGAVLSSAHNLIEQLHDATAHAEILAIRATAKTKQNWRLSGLTLYSTVEPCIMCSGAILQSRIKRVVFGCHDPKFGGSICNIFSEKKLNHQIELTHGPLSEDAASLMRRFFKQRRAK